METNGKIPIKNIYYMLAYAYKTLNFSEYKNLNYEKFDNILELYIEILSLGIPKLIKEGLYKEYIVKSENATLIKGKIDINASIKTNSLIDKKLVIIYDEFSEDILLNQIIKATIVYIFPIKDLNKRQRKKLIGLLPYFQNVKDINLNLNLWNDIKYNKQNLRYKFIIDICRFLYEEVLLNHSNSNDRKCRSIYDEQNMSALYEKFVYEFYKKETPYDISRPHINWNVDDNYSIALPIMKTDLVIKDKNKTLIIDTKYYEENMSRSFKGSKKKHKSGNLYQIFSYINNWKSESNEEIGAILLYAKTKSNIQPNHHYNIGGNKISVLSLDLDQDFSLIKNDLLKYADDFFNNK